MIRLSIPIDKMEKIKIFSGIFWYNNLQNTTIEIHNRITISS